MNDRSRIFVFPSDVSKVGLDAASSGAMDHPLIPQDLITCARRLKALRNERSSIFDSALFGEPAWDILLSLYIAEGEGYRLKIGDLVEESGAATTTALRWIWKLEEINLITRRPHPTDQRTFYVEPTERAVRQLTAYFSGVRGKFGLAV